MTHFENASIQKTANVYFDGKCISHNLTLPDGSRKSVGVILPATLEFNTGAPEIMEVLAGQCRVTLADAPASQTYEAGQSFNVPGNSHFTIEVTDTLHYVCHFG